MIFEETEDGMTIEIQHREMMCMDTEQFISLILMARQMYKRQMYKRHNHADMDDDNPDKE